ncbi:MAG: hypothetical protein P8Y80_15685, partial [Acidobacteriota bacterium]
ECCSSYWESNSTGSGPPGIGPSVMLIVHQVLWSGRRKSADCGGRRRTQPWGSPWCPFSLLGRPKGRWFPGGCSQQTRSGFEMESRVKPGEWLNQIGGVHVRPLDLSGADIV